MTTPNPFPPSLAGGNRVADLTVDALNTPVLQSLSALSIGGTSVTIPTHVGIGKAATSQPLDVSGNANVSGFLYASNVGIGTSVVSSALTVAGDVACSGNVNVTGFMFASNVGIGTSVVGYPLTVEGDISCSGKYRGDGSLLTGISGGGGGGGSVPQTFSDVAANCYTSYATTDTGVHFEIGADISSTTTAPSYIKGGGLDTTTIYSTGSLYLTSLDTFFIDVTGIATFHT